MLADFNQRGRRSRLRPWFTGSLFALAVTLLYFLLSRYGLLPLEAQLVAVALTALYLITLLAQRRRLQTMLGLTEAKHSQQWETINQELQDEIFIRQQAERSFRTSSRRYRALIEMAGSPIIVMDPDFTIRQWNGAAERLFGYQREDIIGKNYVHCFVPAPHQDETAWKITKALEDKAGKECLEAEALTGDGRRHIMLWNINRVEDLEEQTTQAIVIGQEITDIRLTQERLHYLAHYDELTGAANRRLFEDRCRQAIKSAERGRHQVGLMHLDIDHFKRVNDTLGHAAGDLLLREIADRLRRCVRKEDTVARLGGDEFAVLLHQVSSAEGAEVVARNLLDAIVQPIQLPGQELVITTSLGLALAPSDGQDYDELLKNADMAMYRAKQAGRNNLQFYHREMNDDFARQLQLEQELRTALQEHQFRIHYQPVIDLESGRIVALEALLRWQHPTRGLLQPEDFLKIAESSGLLIQIGAWVLMHSCLQGRAVQVMSEHPVQICVNLSQRQFHHPDLLKLLTEILKETRFDPHFLALEINETSIVTQPEESIQTLRALTRLGLALTLDSFGSGFMSLIHLARFPISTVKIGRHFIRGIPDQENKVAVTETLLTIAHKMGLRVIAEGIEHPEQEAFFRAHQCRYLQGYLYARPVPHTALPDLFHGTRQGYLDLTARQIGLPLDKTAP